MPFLHPGSPRNQRYGVALTLLLLTQTAAGSPQESVDSNTVRNGMHSCPPGTFVAGIRVDQNLLLCSAAFGTHSQEVVDAGTKSFDMHACPPGMAVTGIQVNKNLLACAPINGSLAEQWDAGTVRANMHACPSGFVTMGVHVEENWLLCGRVGAPGFMAPMDLSGTIVDDNNLYRNPRWGWQQSNSTPPNPVQVCFDPTAPGFLTPTFGTKPCTTQQISFDSGAFCGPHVNWFDGTYQGQLTWEEKSTEIKDDDYNFLLSPLKPGWDPTNAGGFDPSGLTLANPGSFEIEFDSDETIDRFRTPWWQLFHAAVDAGPGCGIPNCAGGAAAHDMVDGRFAIVIGLVTLDCPHSCKSELHPVHVLAIRAKDLDPADEVWAIFVRNWGNEGFCTSRQHPLDRTSISLRLPWSEGASSVSVAGGTQFEFGPGTLSESDRAQISGPNITYSPNQGVLVRFTLPPPEAHAFDGEHAFIDGELHLSWSGAHVTARPRKKSFVVGEGDAAMDDKPEHRFEAVWNKMTPAQQASYRTILPKRRHSGAHGVRLGQPRAVRVQALPVTEANISAKATPDTEMAKRARERAALVCSVFNGSIPGFPGICGSKFHPKH